MSRIHHHRAAYASNQYPSVTQPRMSVSWSSASCPLTACMCGGRSAPLSPSTWIAARRGNQKDSNTRVLVDDGLELLEKYTLYIKRQSTRVLRHIEKESERAKSTATDAEPPRPILLIRRTSEG